MWSRLCSLAAVSAVVMAPPWARAPYWRCCCRRFWCTHGRPGHESTACDPFSLWGMVVRQFRLLIQAREILDGRGNQNDVARALGVHPFVAEKTTQQAAHFSIETLEQIYRRLLRVDEEVKTGQLTLELAMDTLVAELAGR